MNKELAIMKKEPIFQKKLLKLLSKVGIKDFIFCGAQGDSAMLSFQGSSLEIRRALIAMMMNEPDLLILISAALVDIHTLHKKLKDEPAMSIH